MASATSKPRISRTLEARELILGAVIEVGVVYLQTGNELSGRGSMYNRTLAGEIDFCCVSAHYAQFACGRLHIVVYQSVMIKECCHAPITCHAK